MHKFFAKTRFIGKNIISLPECHSTNDFLLSLARSGSAISGTVVQTDNQTMGRGQRGNLWESEPGKNLIFSILVTQPELKISHQYRLNIIAALALRRVICQYLPDDELLQVKWPNDVYINDKKVAGILAECSLYASKIEWFVLGIGLNVDQTIFRTAEKATSLRLAGAEIEKWSFLEEYSVEFENLLITLNKSFQEIRDEYYQNLRWMGEMRTFADTKGNSFSGVIKGIDDMGRLSINRDGKLRNFDVKEVRFLA